MCSLPAARARRDFSAGIDAGAIAVSGCRRTIRIGEPSGDRTQDPLIKSDAASHGKKRSENASAGTSETLDKSEGAAEGGESR
jgi:hypothetical protein